MSSIPTRAATARRLALTVPCPTCEAHAGQPCRDWAGHWRAPHFARYHASTVAHYLSATRDRSS